MANFLGPFYDYIHVDRAESLFGASLMTSYPIGNLDHVAGLRYTSATTAVSFEFIATKNGSLKYVDLWLKMVGNIGTGSVTVSLHANSAGLPGAAIGSASQPVQVLDIPSGEWTRVRFTFATPISVVALTTYHIAINGTYPISTTNYLEVGADSSPTVAARSDVYNGSAWSPVTYLVLHELFLLEQGAVSQTFRASGDQDVDTIVLYLKKTGSPSGNLFIELQEDILGQPTGAVPANAMSDPIPASSLGSIYGPVAFSFTPRPQLDDGKTYHIILRSTGTLSSANNVDVGVDGSNPSFVAGRFNRSNNDGTWYAYPTIDAAFLVYYEEKPLPSTLADELMTLGDPPLDCQDLALWMRTFRDTMMTFYPAILPPQYGGTGMANYQKGDMLFASAPGHLEVLPAGPDGTTLSMAQGIPTWGGSGSNLVQSYINNSGSTLYPYDAVVFDRTMPEAVIPSDMGGMLYNNMFAGIVQEPIAPGARGAVLTHGITRARASSAIVAGAPLMPIAGTRLTVEGGRPLGGAVALEPAVDGQLFKVFVNVSNHQPPQQVYHNAGGYTVNSGAVWLGKVYSSPASIWRIMYSFGTFSFPPDNVSASRTFTIWSNGTAKLSRTLNSQFQNASEKDWGVFTLDNSAWNELVVIFTSSRTDTGFSLTCVIDEIVARHDMT